MTSRNTSSTSTGTWCWNRSCLPRQSTAVIGSWTGSRPWTRDFPEPLVLGQEKTPEDLYISNILEADPVFRPLIALPETLDVVETVTGGPYRLNHTYTIYRWGGGYTRLHMHGTPIIPKCQYHCRNGQMISTLTKVVFPLLDCEAEDGCFAVIPGAHKSNFPRPWGGVANGGVLT